MEEPISASAAMDPATAVNEDVAPISEQPGAGQVTEMHSGSIKDEQTAESKETLLLRDFGNGSHNDDTSGKDEPDSLMLRDFHTTDDDGTETARAMSELLLNSAVPSHAKSDKANNNPYTTIINRPSSHKTEIGVCLYGPSRVYLAGMLSRQAHELAKDCVATVPKDVSGVCLMDREDSDEDEDDRADGTADTADGKSTVSYSPAGRTSEPIRAPIAELPEPDLPEDDVANDPRWTGKDGWPRLAPRYEHGLQDIGSLSSQRRLIKASSSAMSENDSSHFDEGADAEPKDAPIENGEGQQEGEGQGEPNEVTQQADMNGAGPNRNISLADSIPSSSASSTSTSPPNHVIDMNVLRRIASQGISDNNGCHRAVAWRVLLGYLPPETEKWEAVLKENRTLYRNLVAELFVKPTVALEQQQKYHQQQQQQQHIDNGGTPLPYNPSSNSDGFLGLVPARIREQWKADGREQIMESHVNNHIKSKRNDSGTLSVSSDELEQPEDFCHMDYATSHVNALLVVDDDGYAVDDKDKTQPRMTANDVAPKKSNGDEGANDVEEDRHFDETKKWNQFFENAALLDEIRKDVVRTHPDLHFFLEPDQNLGQRRYAALERILFVWAKLNRGVRYVQGMNEIVGTIYFVLANDTNEEWAAEAEADTYMLFNILMMEIRDVFVPDLDEADTGIQGRIANMMQLLSLHDPEIKCHLSEVGIDASFYSIRWLTTLLSREFTLPDTIRLWDSMFASTHKDNFLRYVCVTMVMMIRSQLLQGDFSVCLRLLQSYPPTNVDRMLESSRALWIYESQITLACHKGGISLSQALATIDPPPGVMMAYGLVGGRSIDPFAASKKAAMHYAKDAAEETASIGRRFFGSVRQGWHNARNRRRLSSDQGSQDND